MSISRRTFAKRALTASALATIPPSFFGVERTAQSVSSHARTGQSAAPPVNAPAQGSLSLLESMRLAGEHLLVALNPKENYLPYFIMKIGKDYRATYEFTWPSHNIGRWIDAMLRLENATGFVIPTQLEAAMMKNLRWFFDNPDNLLIPPAKYAMLSEPPNQLEIHSSREALLALNALARFRGNRWAPEQAHRMMETIWRVSRANGDWDYDGIAATRSPSNWRPALPSIISKIQLRPTVL